MIEYVEIPGLSFGSIKTCQGVPQFEEFARFDEYLSSLETTYPNFRGWLHGIIANHELDDNWATVVALSKHGKTVGIAIASRVFQSDEYPAGFMKINSLYVAIGSRRRGVAKALVKYASVWFRDARGAVTSIAAERPTANDTWMFFKSIGWELDRILPRKPKDRPVSISLITTSTYRRNWYDVGSETGMNGVMEHAVRAAHQRANESLEKNREGRFKELWRLNDEAAARVAKWPHWMIDREILNDERGSDATSKDGNNQLDAIRQTREDQPAR